MNIQNSNKSTDVFFGSATSGTNRSKHANDTSNKNGTKRSDIKKSKNSILTTEINLNQQDSVTMKKIKAQKEAMKTIISQFTSDQKVDNNLNSRREHISALDNEIDASQKEVSEIENLKQQVKDASGVNDNSEEQANLELLEKQKKSLEKGSFVKLTGEEKQKLSTMGPLTEYQSAILDYDSMQAVWKDKLKVANSEKQGEIGAISGIKKELLKIHPMFDAKVEAKNILDAANEEVTGMLINEAKDHIDEEQAKAEEKAKKETEKKTQDDALKEKAVENYSTLNDNNETGSNSNKIRESNNSNSIDNMSQIQKAEREQQKLQVEIKNLVDSQKLTIDDTKGIVVDQQL